jgi:hypothetical protein
MDLFPSLPITKSPKLLWMERYKISSVEHKEIQGYTWTATYRKWLNEQCRVTYDCAGKTEDAALTALALAAGIKLWNEEVA